MGKATVVIGIVTFLLIGFCKPLTNAQIPSFDVPVVNVTATSGTTAILPCTINFLGDHKMVWMDPRGKLLTMEDRRIIQDQRISIERPYTRDWNIHIRSVQPADAGSYECQINTEPVKRKIVILHVNEPPRIIEHLSASDTVVKEGDTVTLWCNVTGIPLPKVTWFRRSVHQENAAKEGFTKPHWSKSRSGRMKQRWNGKWAPYVDEQSSVDCGNFGGVIGSKGEILIIHNISRYCDDVYECMAFNGIEPADSRKIKVTVEFPPEVELFTTRMSQARGKETILDCKITANPHGLTLWRKDGRDIKNSWKYGVTVFEDQHYTKTLSLRIASIDENDFGQYTCVAQNPFGSDKEAMILYEFVEVKPTTTSTTTTTTTVYVIHPNDHWTPWDTNTYLTDRPDEPNFQPSNSGGNVGSTGTGSYITVHLLFLLATTTYGLITVTFILCR